jgi:hypothetical protein
MDLLLQARVPMDDMPGKALPAVLEENHWVTGANLPSLNNFSVSRWTCCKVKTILTSNNCGDRS